MKFDLQDKDLLKAVESAYDVVVKGFVRIQTGAQSANYKATLDNGEKFIVKVLCSENDARRIVSNCRVLEPVNGVKCLFGGKVVSIGGYSVICLSYCEGDEVRFDEYTRDRVDALIDAYKNISVSMQAAENPHPCRQLKPLRDHLLKKLEEIPAGKKYADLVERLTGTYIDVDSGKYSVIHGDFHHANFRCSGNSVVGIFDFMEFRLGYPTEDFVRLVLCSFDRLRWYRYHRVFSMFENFRYLVSKTDFPYEQWASAIDGYFLRKVMKNMKKRKFLNLSSLNLRLVLFLYRRLKRIAKTHAREIS